MTKLTHTLRAALRLSFAPGMLLLFGAAALALIQAGHSHFWLLGLLAAAALLSCLAERFAPYEPRWNRAQGDLGRDLLHALVNESGAMASVLLLPWLSAYAPFAELWPAQWPLWLQWLLAVLVADAGITLTHWASHHWAPLWRLHAVHHAVERFHGLNGLVKHPLHQLIETGAGTLPLLLIGLPAEVAALLAFAAGLQLLLQHSNVDMRIGSLRHVWAVAPVHRFHHRKWAGIGDVNFGLFTTFWDRLLGTAVFDPQARFGPGDFGIGTRPDYPQAYLAQLVEPFKPEPAAISGSALPDSR